MSKTSFDKMPIVKMSTHAEAEAKLIENTIRTSYYRFMAQKKKNGRPTLFKKSCLPKVRKLAMLGCTDVQIAAHLGISPRTLDLWKTSQASFIRTLKEAREGADGEVVRSLWERATGYTCDDVHVAQYMGQVIVTPIKKHYPPDPASMIFWLKNRRPDLWRDVPVQPGPQPTVNVTLIADRIAQLSVPDLKQLPEPTPQPVVAEESK